uniref:RING-type domain-containing protein n=1 Tax=Arcella intermedia TaxID=1963864 RepID=A0A6B2L4U0_9EUKA
MGEIWRGMAEEEKSKYFKKAEQAREKWRKDMSEYRKAQEKKKEAEEKEMNQSISSDSSSSDTDPPNPPPKDSPQSDITLFDQTIQIISNLKHYFSTTTITDLKAHNQKLINEQNCLKLILPMLEDEEKKKLEEGAMCKTKLEEILNPSSDLLKAQSILEAGKERLIFLKIARNYQENPDVKEEYKIIQTPSSNRKTLPPPNLETLEKLMTDLKSNLQKIEDNTTIYKQEYSEAKKINEEIKNLTDKRDELSQSIKLKEKELTSSKNHLLLFTNPEKITQDSFTPEETREVETKINTALRKITLEEAKKELGLQITSDILCIVCMERERKVKFSPCNHDVTCNECSNVLNKCPNCRAPITSREAI